MKEKQKTYFQTKMPFDKKKTKLHIGCGRIKLNGFVNIDIAKEVEPDVIVDVEKGFPFPDNHFDYIYSCNVLEEIRPQYWDFILREIKRVAKNKCILELILNFDNIYNRTRANHYRTFSWDSFFVFDENAETSYSSPIILKNLKERPNIFIRLWYNLFPFLKKSVHFKFKIIKKPLK